MVLNMVISSMWTHQMKVEKLLLQISRADLCTGQQLIFIAGVAHMTNGNTKPQIMFKLFGVNKDVNGEIVDKHLIHSFSSGDFSNNRDQ